MGSIWTPGNSSRTYWTSIEVDNDRFPAGAKAASEVDKNVSGTKIRHGT
jgi:hypothetical protein